MPASYLANNILFHNLADADYLGINKAKMVEDSDVKLSEAILLKADAIKIRISSLDQSNDVNRIKKIINLERRWKTSPLTHIYWDIVEISEIINSRIERKICRINPLDYNFLISINDSTIYSEEKASGLSDKTVYNLFNPAGKHATNKSIMMVFEIFCSEKQLIVMLNNLRNERILRMVTSYKAKNEEYRLPETIYKELAQYLANADINAGSCLDIIRGLFELLQDVEMEKLSVSMSDFDISSCQSHQSSRFHQLTMNYLKSNALIVISLSDRYRVKDELVEAIDDFGEKTNYLFDDDKVYMLYASLYNSPRIYQCFHHYIGGSL